MLTLSAFALLGGCTAAGNITVLPDPDTGRVGAIELLGPDEVSEILRIDTAGGRARLGKGTPKLTQLGPAQQAALASTLASLPPRPTSFVLYFKEGSTELVSESAAALQQILTEVAARPGANVEIIGHTDTIGSEVDNDRVSLERARQVANFIVGRGIDAGIVSVIGRGERDLLAATPDETSDPRNRRIEVIVY